MDQFVWNELSPFPNRDIYMFRLFIYFFRYNDSIQGDFRFYSQNSESVGDFCNQKEVLNVDIPFTVKAQEVVTNSQSVT